jgi:hypothetical protein
MALISDTLVIPPGAHKLQVRSASGTVTLGPITLDAAFVPVLDSFASPASFVLAAPSPVVSLYGGLDRFMLPGPMKIWNGQALIDAPLKLFDGSTLS